MGACHGADLGQERGVFQLGSEGLKSFQLAEAYFKEIKRPFALPRAALFSHRRAGGEAAHDGSLFWAVACSDVARTRRARTRVSQLQFQGERTRLNDALTAQVDPEQSSKFQPISTFEVGQGRKRY